MFLRFWPISLALLLVLASGEQAPAYTPGTGSPTAVQGFVVDSTSRNDVLSYYNTVYGASQNFAAEMDWTGDVASAQAGTTSLTFKEDVRRRVNFYRALCGLGANITFDDTDSADDQLDALMNSAANGITHTPATSYPDYTAAGALAASHSNLAIGYYGPDAIDGYLTDTGSNNIEVGHRRWILYSLANIMGTGDIPPDGSYEPTNSLWVIGSFAPSATPQFVFWPNSGYVPLPLMPARWSVSYPGADFSHATVTMTQGATSIPCTIIYADSSTSNSSTFIGDNTMVWEPSTLPTSLTGDTPYTVTISGIAGISGITTKTYTVTLFDPNVLTQLVTISGPASPPTIGASYTFNSIVDADAYDLEVALGSTAAWTEGAESSPAPQVSADLTGSYPLIQSSVVHTGSAAFQLTFPADVDSSNNLESYDFSDQNFEITRQVIPTGSSVLEFYDNCHLATSTTTLAAQVSSDNGNTWTQVFSRAGQGGSYTDTWEKDDVSLTAYAGKVILVRFVLSGNGGSAYLGTTSQYGVFLDDITITNSTLLTAINDTSLAASATSFMLNATTAGAALQGGSTYYMRISPIVGLRPYAFGAPAIVTAQASGVTGYSSWISNMYPTVTGGSTGDFSNDGIPNGLKYAFGLDPRAHNSPTAIPAPVLSGTNLRLSFTAPTGIAGVTYGAQSSTDLINWTNLSDTGTGSTHTFTTSASGTHVYLRQRITISP
jgi:hypothetical protein